MLLYKHSYTCCLLHVNMHCCVRVYPEVKLLEHKVYMCSTWLQSTFALLQAAHENSSHAGTVSLFNFGHSVEGVVVSCLVFFYISLIMMKLSNLFMFIGYLDVLYEVVI